MSDTARAYALAALVIVLDQISKAIVLGHIAYGETIVVTSWWNWVLAWNPGAAFSFLADQPGWQRWFFSLLALAVAGWLGWALRGPLPRLQYWAFLLILGGALGNLIDRVRFGAVVDFVQWHVAGYYWPAFNVADSAITLGAVLLAADALFFAPPAVKEEK